MIIRDLLDLVESNAPEPEKRVEKTFDWRHERLLEVAKWALGAAGALAATLVTSEIKAEFKVGVAIQVALLGFSIFAAVSGIVAFVRGARLQRNYAASLSLLARLTEFRELIRRYRRT